MIKAAILPDGVEIDGKTYRDYELREQLVVDEVEVLEGEDGARAMKSESFYNVCILARRLTLRGLGRGISSSEMLGMTSVDFNHLVATDTALQAERALFRNAAQAAPDAPSGTPQAGV